MSLVQKMISFTLLNLIFMFSSIAQCDFCLKQEYPIHCAIESFDCGLEDIIMLIESGYNVNSIDSKRGDSPLHRMGYMYNNREDELIVKYLLENGAEPLILDLNGNNCVDLAFKWNKLKLVDFYLKNGILPNAKVHHPYYIAISEGRTNEIKRIKRYEKKSSWNSYLEIPVSLRYDNASIKSIVIQTGLININDDYWFLSSSKGILIGPSFSLEDRMSIGVDVTSFYQFSILTGAIGFRYNFGENNSKYLDPQIGLSLGPYLTMGYSKKIFFEGNEGRSNNIFIRITWPHNKLKINMHKRSSYYNKTRN